MVYFKTALKELCWKIGFICVTKSRTVFDKYGIEILCKFVLMHRLSTNRTDLRVAYRSTIS